jgi:hypothetical protein
MMVENREYDEDDINEEDEDPTPRFIEMRMTPYAVAVRDESTDYVRRLILRADLI